MGHELSNMGSMSSSTCSSPRTSWTSEPDSWEGETTWNAAFNAAYLFETGEILRAFWSWNGATGIPGTCQFAMMLAPIRRTLVWLDHLSGVGRIQNDLGTVEYESEERAAWTMTTGLCAPIVLML